MDRVVAMGGALVGSHGVVIGTRVLLDSHVGVKSRYSIIQHINIHVISDDQLYAFV